jgi:transposase
VVAELGDLTRFRHPRELMAYLGLAPSEHSSGPSVRRGAITKAGNPHVRRVLAEAAWAYQGIPRIGRQHPYRQEALPKVVSSPSLKRCAARTTGERPLTNGQHDHPRR